MAMATAQDDGSRRRRDPPVYTTADRDADAIMRVSVQNLRTSCRSWRGSEFIAVILEVATLPKDVARVTCWRTRARGRGIWGMALMNSELRPCRTAQHCFWSDRNFE